MDHPQLTVINTDGSSRNNGKVYAVAGAGVFFGYKDPRNISSPVSGEQTNQRAEVLAIKLALEAVSPFEDVLIRTDSMYAKNAITKNWRNWRYWDWKKPYGVLRKNADLIEPTFELLERRRVRGVVTKFEWVKGHAGDEGNEAADNLAVAGAMKALVARKREESLQARYRAISSKKQKKYHEEQLNKFSEGSAGKESQEKSQGDN